ncbi:MAG: DUF1552 domain-containing protein [Planctomycetales bacterium]|nr:DUF1552 domain-containing protein [Planctomycetales bacterium]
MNRKSWRLPRRTFLQGAGAALALPLLDCMGSETGPRPRRFLAVYFPYGVVVRKPNDEQSRWNWLPQQPGRAYKFTKTLSPLAPHREQLSLLGGLSHPHGRRMGGHDTADIFLTAAELKGDQLQNSVSLDQLIAARHSDATRQASLVLSTDGGVGEPTRASTLSFSRTGQPVPAENRPQLVFDRLFGAEEGNRDSQQRRLNQSGSMLDTVLEHSRSVRRSLGEADRQKLDEYLAAVRQIELRVERAQRWLDIPKPEIDSQGLHLSADDSTPQELIQTMYDLIYWAFRTDSTRVATYQLGNMNGATSIAGKFPQLLGMGKQLHALAHGAGKGKGGEELGRWQQFLSTQLAYLLQRLQDTPEGDGNLLDHTIVLYGSSNSTTHRNENYPLLVAGGSRLGMRHGQFHQLDATTPFSNLLLTILRRLDVPAERFADSTGDLAELL